MERFKNILVTVDGRSHPGAAVSRAIALAKGSRNNVRVAIVGVVEELPHALAREVPELHSISLREREDQVQRLSAHAKSQGVPATHKVLVGTPFLEVIREVLRSEFDLVIKVAEGAGKRRASLLGSTDTRLLRKCPCPVWIIAAPRVKRFTRIMAAVEADRTDHVRMDLDRDVLDLGIELAKLDKGELHVVHAWSLFGESILRGHMSGTRKGELTRLLRETRGQHQASLDQLMRRYAGDPEARTHLHLVKGEAAHVIADLIQEERIGLLVMGTVGRVGVPGFVIGNTAERVLRLADCSILAIKPRGFVSPVKVARAD